MQGNPILRKAQIKDISAIEKLLSKEKLPSVGAIEEIIDSFWVLDERGNIIGSVCLEIFNDLSLIRSVVVAQEKRNCGLGDRLMQVALGEALDHGIRRVYLFTINAESFFISFGFRKCTLEEFELAIQDCSQYKAMIKNPELYPDSKPMLLELGSPLNSTQ